MQYDEEKEKKAAQEQKITQLKALEDKWKVRNTELDLKLLILKVIK